MDRIPVVLYLVAVVLFVLAGLDEGGDLIPWGLAALAGGCAAKEL